MRARPLVSASCLLLLLLLLAIGSIGLGVGLYDYARPVVPRSNLDSIFHIAGCTGHHNAEVSFIIPSQDTTMSNVQHLHNRRYASLACNGCRESKIKVLTSFPRASPETCDMLMIFSVMGKSQVVQTAARRTGNAFIVLSTSGSKYVSAHGAQC
jgi:hypothetical protein